MQLLLLSSHQDASSAGFLDSLLSGLGEHLGLHNDWDLGQLTLAKHLEEALVNELIDLFAFFYN